MTDPVRVIAARIRRRCGSLAVAEILDQRSVPWRSLLFDGARHRIQVSLRGDGVERALEALGEMIGEDDFGISGHLVAELKFAMIERRGDDALVTLDALTVEDC